QNPFALIPSSHKFHKYWIGIDGKHIVLGRGRSEILDHHDILLHWKDPDPLQVQYIGLMTWDVAVQFRSLLVGTVQHPLRVLVKEHKRSIKHSRRHRSALLPLLQSNQFADWHHPAFPGIDLHKAVVRSLCPFLLSDASLLEQISEGGKERGGEEGEGGEERDPQALFLHAMQLVYSADCPEIVSSAHLAELRHIRSFRQLFAWAALIPHGALASPVSSPGASTSSPTSPQHQLQSPSSHPQHPQLLLKPVSPQKALAPSGKSFESPLSKPLKSSAHRPRSSSYTELPPASYLSFRGKASSPTDQQSGYGRFPSPLVQGRDLFSRLWEEMRNTMPPVDAATLDSGQLDPDEQDSIFALDEQHSSSTEKRPVACPFDVHFLLEDGSSVWAHKVVLSLRSLVFRAMLSSGMIESEQLPHIAIKDIDPQAFRCLVAVCYTGYIESPQSIEECLDILVGADRFGIGPIAYQALMDYAHGAITAQNVCFVLYIIDYFGFSFFRFYSHCVTFAKKHFAEVSASRGWSKYLPFNVLIDIIRSDDLMVITERFVFEAVLKWLAVDFPRRQSHLEELLAFVRFRLIDREYLNRALQESAIILAHGVLRDYVKRKLQRIDDLTVTSVGESAGLTSLSAPVAVVKAQDLEVKGLLAASRRSRSIKGSNLVECLFSHAGDRNGVLHYLGTGMKKHETWINPVKRGLVNVHLSCAPTRYCQRFSFVGADFRSTSFITGSPPWLMIDLGASCAMIITSYTIQHDGSDNYLRDWELQASEDNETWLVIYRHIADRTVSQPGQFARWSIDANLSRQGFRYIRLIQNPSQGTRMSLCRVEFYGFLKIIQTGSSADRPLSPSILSAH
ncbi:MAG: BTB/POZ domain-containing protein, partial [archaeon]|nr:BTB/POZ domain-containing protein [archaeon]